MAASADLTTCTDIYLYWNQILFFNLVNSSTLDLSLHSFKASSFSTTFHDFPRAKPKSKDSPGLENEIIKFHFFQCLPGPVQTSGIYFSNKLSLLMFSTKFPVLHHTSLSGLWGSMRRYGCPALHSTTCESPNHAT